MWKIKHQMNRSPLQRRLSSDALVFNVSFDTSGCFNNLFVTVDESLSKGVKVLYDAAFSSQ